MRKRDWADDEADRLYDQVRNDLDDHDVTLNIRDALLRAVVDERAKVVREIVARLRAPGEDPPGPPHLGWAEVIEREFGGMATTADPSAAPRTR